MNKMLFSEEIFHHFNDNESFYFLQIKQRKMFMQHQPRAHPTGNAT